MGRVTHDATVSLGPKAYARAKMAVGIAGIRAAGSAFWGLRFGIKPGRYDGSARLDPDADARGSVAVKASIYSPVTAACQPRPREMSGRSGMVVM